MYPNVVGKVSDGFTTTSFSGSFKGANFGIGRSAQIHEHHT